MKAETKKAFEPYAAGSVLTFVWQFIFTKVLLAIDMYTAVIISLVSAIMFFIVAVLVLESSGLKGKL